LIVTTEGRRAEPKNIYRFGAFVVAVAVGVTALGAKMVDLQVLKGQDAFAVPSVPETATQNIASSRGMIFSADDQPLAENVVTYTVTVTPSELTLAEEPIVAQRLATLLSSNPVDIETTIDSATGSLYTPVKVAENVPVEVARFIEENSDLLPSVQVVAASHRVYPQGELFSDVIGYTGQITQSQYDALKTQGYSTSDVIGQNGLEASYEAQLRGTYGDETVALDSGGKPIPGLVTGHNPPVPGDTLTLTIDTKQQQMAYEALNWGLVASHVTQGVIIVENPQNGNILAMVSLPTYDDQKFADGISDADFQKLLSSPDQPLLNKAIAAEYAPGSTFKLVTGTAGLQDGPACVSQGQAEPFNYCSGNFNASTIIQSQPFIMLGGQKFVDWNGKGFGPLNIIGGMANSSDTFFYQVARMVGLDRLAFWATQYGFGAPTGIDLPYEASGIVPTDAWKYSVTNNLMYVGDIAQMGIGQGYDAATPMQLLNAYSALANGGKLWQPHVVQSLTDAKGNVIPIQPTLLNTLPASAQTLETMRLATRAVVTSRHTGNLVDLPINVAGKTGTAEFATIDKNGVLPYHEWFVGYVPADPHSTDFTKTDSQLAVVAFVYGANTEGNVATEIVKYYLMLHYGIDAGSRKFSSQTPGYIPSYVTRRTNFYQSQNTRD
jgi:penicillin-binding protein 2